MKLRTKLLVYILSMSLLIFLAVHVYNAVKTESLARRDAAKYVDATAREYANDMKVAFNSDITTCRTLKHTFEEFDKIPTENRFKTFNLMMESVLKENPQFVSVWANWELNAIDPSYKKEHGRIRYSYYREDGKILYSVETLDTATNNPTGTYYDLKANPAEILTEPYWFSYEQSTSQILEASIATPVMIDGKFSGLIGADVDIYRFHSLIDIIQPFEGSYAMLLSNEGKIVAHPNHDLMNKDITESGLDIYSNKDIKDMLQAGKGFSVEMQDDNNKENYVSFAPFKMGNTNNPWFIGVVVPKSVILADARKSLLIAVVVGLVGIILFAILTWVIARRITSPLVETTSVMNELAQGKIRGAAKIKSDTNDEIAEMATALNTLSHSIRVNAEFANAIGKGDLKKEFTPLGEQDVLGNALLKMRDNLVQLQKINDENSWINSSLIKVNDLLQGEKSAEELGSEVLAAMAGILEIQIGAIFIEKAGMFRLSSSWAYNVRKGNSNEFKPGEGMIGQAVLEKKVLIFTDIPQDYISIKSGLGECRPTLIIIVPLLYQNEVVGVMELGTTGDFDEIRLNFINQVSENIAIAINSIRIRNEMRELLIKTQEQSEELRVQQEELREANEELEAQTRALKKSESELQEQQEELRVTNEELEEKTHFLETQRSEISEKNLKLENAQKDLERKAEELSIASKYKSEFLANMSHELRTPLNSLLILSRSLADNTEGNLDKEQIESAEIIYKSGNDLLSMINDILDLSKIESGKMSVNYEEVHLAEVKENLQQYFRHQTDQKGIEFELDISGDLPSGIETDQQKLEQILKNFISNAIKFTDKGSIKVSFSTVSEDADLSRSGLNPGEAFIVSVEDTGIGIPKEKQLEIFEAFQQADGSTSRHYGGTGLGLSISRELAKLLGGEIQLESEPGSGSTFTLFLPQKPSGVKKIAASSTVMNEIITPAKKEIKRKVLNENLQSTEPRVFIADDRDKIGEDDAVILVIEDDPDFAKVLLKQCHAKKFKCVASPEGEDGFSLAREIKPNAIILDINLPGISGIQVLEMLKDDNETRHIPVHIMSGEDATIDAYKKGAVDYLTKPISKEDLNKVFGKIRKFSSRKMSKLLLIEDNAELRQSIKKLIGEKDVQITDAGKGEDALRIIRNETFDCMVLDLGLPDMSGFELIREFDKMGIEKPPIIVYTGKDLSREESEELQKYAETIIIKGVKSEERLLDETALFLHRVIGEMPEKQRKIIQNLHNNEELFKNKKVLLVDDDMRNVFALTKILKQKEMNVLRAENGQAALDILQKEEDVDIILMDIMMPVMNGYEAIQKIRKDLKMNKVPVIALTAKAMKEDRQKCIDAGANDYLAKPINIEKLSSLMKVWLYN